MLASMPPLRRAPGPAPRASIAPVDEPQVITEPARIVGRSGKTLATLGEGGQDEELTIRPVGPRPASRRGARKGVPGYQTGGTVITMSNLKDQPRGTSLTAHGITAISGGDGKTYSPASFQSTFGQSPSGPSPTLRPPPPVGDTGGRTIMPRSIAAAPSAPAPAQGAAGQDIYAAESNVLEAQQRDIAANRNVLAAQGREVQAQGGIYDAQGRELDAQGRVLNERGELVQAQGRIYDAQGRELDAQGRVIGAQRTELQASRAALGSSRAYLEEQQRATELSRQEEEAVQAAGANVEDQTATARALRTRQNQDYRYTAAGLAPPVEVDVPEGDSVHLGPGVRSRLRTQEDIVAEDATQARALRGFDLDEAQQAAQAANLAAQAAGMDVSGAQLDLAQAGIGTSRARIAAGRQGLDVDTAQLAASRAGLDTGRARIAAGRAGLDTSRARIAAGGAGLDVSQAGLDLDIAQRPPVPGMVLDPYSGTFVTRAEFDIRQRGRGVVYDEINRLYVPHLELTQRTDAAGNVLRLSDNVWVDPQTQNELLNGTWTDPKTGWQLIQEKPAIWLDPATGNKNIEGTWWTPSGFYLQGNGVWRNPVTDEFITPDGVIHASGGSGGGGGIVWNPATGQFELSGASSADAASAPPPTGNTTPSTATGGTPSTGTAPVWTNPATGEQVPWRPPTFQ